MGVVRLGSTGSKRVLRGRGVREESKGKRGEGRKGRGERGGERGREEEERKRDLPALSSLV